MKSGTVTLIMSKLFFEILPLNPLPNHRFDKNQTLTTFSLGQSPIESEMSLRLTSTQILIMIGLVSEKMWFAG